MTSFLENVQLPYQFTNTQECLNWFDVMLLQFSERRYDRRINNFIKNYQPISDIYSNIDLTLHNWQSPLLDSDLVYDLIKKVSYLKFQQPLFIQVKGHSHTPVSWSSYNDHNRFHNLNDTPIQTIIYYNDKFIVSDEYSINKLKKNAYPKYY